MHRRLPASDVDNIRLRAVAKVRELRTERRWTQAVLAEKLGLSPARLSEIERGGGSFTAEQFLEVLRLFNVNVDAFAGPQRVEDELRTRLPGLARSTCARFRDRSRARGSGESALSSGKRCSPLRPHRRRDSQCTGAREGTGGSSGHFTKVGRDQRPSTH